jgi:metallopeptidase MepB
MSIDGAEVPPQLTPVFTTSPHSILEKTRSLIEQPRKVQRQVLEDVEFASATFTNVILPLAYLENVAVVESHVLLFYRFVSADREPREASRKAPNLWDEFCIDTARNDGLFNLVNVVLEKHEELDQESLLLLQKKHKTQ